MENSIQDMLQCGEKKRLREREEGNAEIFFPNNTLSFPLFFTKTSLTFPPFSFLHRLMILSSSPSLEGSQKEGRKDREKRKEKTEAILKSSCSLNTTLKLSSPSVF